MRTGERTDGHDEANSRSSQFCERTLKLSSESNEEFTSIKSTNRLMLFGIAIISLSFKDLTKHTIVVLIFSTAT